MTGLALCKRRVARAVECGHGNRKHYGHGMCKPCWRASRKLDADAAAKDKASVASYLSKPAVREARREYMRAYYAGMSKLERECRKQYDREYYAKKVARAREDKSI